MAHPPPRGVARRAALPLAFALVLPLAASGCRSPRHGGQELLPTVLYLAVGINNDDTLNAEVDKEVRGRLALLRQGFRAIHPAVGTQVQADLEDRLPQELWRRTQSGMAPDLLLVNGETALRLHRQGLTRSVRVSAAVTEPLDPAAVGRMRLPDGSLAGLPVVDHPQVACRDRRLLPASPSTLDELMAASRSGIPMGLVIDPVPLAWTLGALGAADSLADLAAGRPAGAADRQRLAGWLRWLRRAGREGVHLSAHQEEVVEAMEAGRLAWIPCRGTHLPRLRAALGPHLGVAPLPAGPGGAPSPLTRQRVFAFGRNSSPGQRQAAEAFARFAVNSTVQRAMTLTIEEVLPANRRVAVPAGRSPVLQALVEGQRQGSRADRLAGVFRDHPGLPAPMRAILLRFLYGELEEEGATGELVTLLGRREGR